MNRRDTSIHPAVRALGKRLHEKHIKLSTLLARCRALDGNNDDLIHIHDLEEILIDYLGVDKVNQRELQQLALLLKPDNVVGRDSDGIIAYRKLTDILESIFNTIDRLEYPNTEKETWYDPEVITNRAGVPSSYSRARKGLKNMGGNFDQGSLGEWIEECACPMEIKNLQRFMECMEKYERQSGVKCLQIEDGVILPLGPDLKAKISFYR